MGLRNIFETSVVSQEVPPKFFPSSLKDYNLFLWGGNHITPKNYNFLGFQLKNSSKEQFTPKMTLFYRSLTP